MAFKELRVLVSGMALIGAASIGAVTTSSASASEGSASASASAGAVAVELSSRRTISMPAAVQPGVNQFDITSAKPSGFQIARLAEGYTSDEAERDMNKGLGGGKMGALRRFEANVTLIGGVATVPGKAASFWVDLEPGSYVALDTLGKINASKWVTFMVEGADTGLAMPEGASVKATRSATWSKKPASIPNKGTLTFKNHSSGNHFVVLVKMRKGATLKQVKQFLQTESGPPPVDFRHSLDSAVISPGQSLAFNYRLPKGNYAMLCFWPDASMGGMPHAFMGMVRSIKLK